MPTTDTFAISAPAIIPRPRSCVGLDAVVLRSVPRKVGLLAVAWPSARHPPASHNAARSDWKFAIRALRHRNYLLFFSGQTVSLIGTWMTRIATSWLVYRLTGSAFLLGLVGFSGQIPFLLLGPFAGVWVDRWNRHRVLVVTQILSMVQSFAWPH